MRDFIKRWPLGHLNIVGQIATALWQWVLTIWLMRVFGADTLGRYTFVLAVISPLLLFSNFQLRTRLVAQPELLGRVSSYLKLRLLTALGSVIFATAIVMLLQPDMTLEFLFGVLVFKAIEAISELVHGVLQAESKHRLVGSSMLLKAALGLFLMALSYLMKWPVGVFFATMALSQVIVSLVIEWRYSETLVQGKPDEVGAWRTLMEDPYLLTSGTMALLTALNASWPRLIMQKTAGLESLGHFTALFALYAALGVALNVWLQNTLGHMSAVAPNRKARDRFLSKLAMQIGIYHVVGALILVPFGTPILEFLFGTELPWGMEEVLLLVLLSFIAGMSTLMYYFLLATGYMVNHWVIMFMANVFTFLVGGWLIPTMPIGGAIAALMAGAVWQLAAYGVMTHSVLVDQQEAE